jgi:hypothetical protein
MCRRDRRVKKKMMHLNIQLSEWMKATIRCSSEPYLGILTPSWAWLQTASLKAINNTMVSFCIIIYEGLQFCLLTVCMHQAQSCCIGTNQSCANAFRMGRLSHVAEFTNRDRRGMEECPPPFQRYRTARPSAKCTRNAPCAMFGDANFMWSGQCALRHIAVPCRRRRVSSCTYVGTKLQP